MLPSQENAGQGFNTDMTSDEMEREETRNIMNKRQKRRPLIGEFDLDDFELRQSEKDALMG